MRSGQIACEGSGNRLGTDVFPTLQGTGIQIFSGYITRRKSQVYFTLAVDNERFAYIVYRWLNDQRLSSYLQDDEPFVFLGGRLCTTKYRPT